MATRTLLIEHDGTEYRGEIATIKSTHLGPEDHGIFTAYVNCGWSGGGVNVGGYNLTTERSGFGIAHIRAVMDVAGASTWEALIGKQVIVLFNESRMAVGLAHATTDKVFILQELSTEWTRREARSLT